MQLPDAPPLRDESKKAAFKSLLKELKDLFDPPPTKHELVQKIDLGATYGTNKNPDSEELTWRGIHVMDVKYILNPQPHAEYHDPRDQSVRTIQTTKIDGVYWEEQTALNGAVRFALLRDNPADPQFDRKSLKELGYTIL